MVQHHAPREAVGSAYGIINGIGNICAAFIPLLMGVVMKSVGSVSSGFSVLVASQLITLCAGGTAAYASRSSSKRVYTLNKLQDKTASRFEQRLRWPRDEARGWADLLPTPMQLEV